MEFPLQISLSFAECPDEVEDATLAFKETVARGARPAREPETFETREGRVTRSEIWTLADVRYAFIERKNPREKHSPALFDEDLVVSRLESPSPLGIRAIDHLTNNVGMGEMGNWVEWYKKVFGFVVSYQKSKSIVWPNWFTRS